MIVDITAALKGKILTKIEESKDRIDFTTEEGRTYSMLHFQDCCECVGIDEIDGNLNDLIGSPITEACEMDTHGLGKPDKEYIESWTWTRYLIATVKGRVIITWLGESNGYYSESVDFVDEEGRY